MSFTPIKDREHALALVRDCGWCAVILSASALLYAPRLGPLWFLDAAACLALGGALLRWRASWAAQLLLAVWGVNLAIAIRFWLLLGPPATRIVMTDALFLWGAVRAVEATHKLNTRFAVMSG